MFGVLRGVARGFFSDPRKHIHYRSLNNIPGASLYKLTHSIQPSESLLDYVERSWLEFKKRLSPDHVSILVHRAGVAGGNVFPGHVASFATNQDR